MQGSFSVESLDKYHTLLKFSEQEGEYDFTRCVRPDGTAYGTRGKCRKGTESAKKEIPNSPRQSRKADTEKPAAEPPKEVKGYKPREKPERSRGLRGIKERIFGRREKKDLDAIVDSPEQMVKDAETKIANLESWKARTTSKKEKKELQKRIDSVNQSLKVNLARSETNRKFAQDLKSNLPASVKASVEVDDMDTREIVLTQKVGKHTIRTTFSQEDGFNYQVNDKYDMGTVKNRREQLRIAMAVRAQYDALARSLPEGTVIHTSAYDGDGAGAARQRAYERIGFSKPEEGALGRMYAMKKGGKMVPASEQQYTDSWSNPNTVAFSEGGEVSKREELKAWIQIVTGVDVGI